MRRRRRAARSALWALPVLLAPALAGCSAEGSDASGAASDEAVFCAPGDLPTQTPGRLTVATDSPAYEPWFVGDDPSNGQGYESAVAYAVAEELGFDRDAVSWVRQPFNTSFAPGEKHFDFDINQVSITPEREKAVSFSEGYYRATQAVVTTPESADRATTLEGLRGLKLGAQVATTSLTAIRTDVKPYSRPLEFESSTEATRALLSGRVDAIVLDLPTAFHLTSEEVPEAVITGQFRASGEPEEFGLLMEKGSPLEPCLDRAVLALRDDGTLERIEQTWLSDVVKVPVLE